MRPKLPLFHALLLLLTPSVSFAEPLPVRHPFACTDYTQGKVFVVSAAGKVEWEFAAETCNDLWVLPNGNTVICNWLGHGQFGKAPHLIEITPDKHVVWSFADHQTMKTISSVQLLDVKGNVTRGEILH